MKKELTAVMILLITLAWSCAAVPPVTKEAGGDIPVKKGIYYCLPKNEVVVNVTVSRTDVGIDAAYPEFASQFGWKYKRDSSFKIENISIANVAVADQSQWYFVEIKPRLLRTINLTYESNGNGIPAAATVESKDQSVEVVTEVIKFGAELAAKFLPLPSMGGMARGVDEKIISRSRSQSQSQSKKDTTSSVPEQGKDFLNRKNKVDELQKEYERLKNNQVDLISNQSKFALTAETFKLMNEAITKKMQDIEVQIVGKERIRTIKLKFVLSNPGETKTLFAFDKKSGLKASSDSVDLPADFRSKTEGVKYAVSITKKPFQLKNGSSENGQSQGSFYYNIPGEVSVAIRKGNAVIKDTLLLMAQAGVVAQLPIKAGHFKSKYEVKFDPTTGALTKISINGEPPSAESLGKAADAAVGLYDKLNPDETERLKKQIELLKLQQELEELNNK
ncbi:MAG: DUF4831 family protein [Bacteroidetes bacterium]|nr:DUF4831 family protein [Bacteroidota bacterium]